MKRISVTILEYLLEESEALSEERLEDRSTLTRQLIAEGLKEENRGDSRRFYMEE